MTECFLPEEIEEIISFNEELVTKRGELFGINREELVKIFDHVNNFDEIIDRKERIIRKAAWILGGISFFQPFHDGNKETALSLTILFLRRNHYDLPIQNQLDKREIYDLLVKTVYKFEGDSTIISEIEEFLQNRIIGI